MVSHFPQKLIWTDHARQRLQDRGLSQPTVEQAIRHAEQRRPGKKANTQEYSARFEEHTVTAVVSPGEKNELIIISCWVDPPFPGTKSWYKKQRWKRYKQLPWWQKLLWLAARQVGVWDF